MTTQPKRHPTKRDPRLPQLDRPTAMRLAATEYERVAVQLEQLRPPQPGSAGRYSRGPLVGLK